MPALTEFCDIFGGVSEQAVNNLIADFQNQRPSLFNYGTGTFSNNPGRLCDTSFIANVDKDVQIFKNPLVSNLDLLAVPGYNGPYGLEYCFQLTRLAIDFQPSNSIQLPPGLDPPLQNQMFALQARIAVGLGAPDAAAIGLAAGAGSSGGAAKPTIPLPFDPANLVSINLDIFAVFGAKQGGPSSDPYIALALNGLELPGLVPAGLESILESYIKVALSLGLLPQVKIALSKLVFNIADMLTISPTAISANVPFNPSIENDQVEVFLTLN